MTLQLTKYQKMVNLLWISRKIGQIAFQKSGKVGVLYPLFLWIEIEALWKQKMDIWKRGKLSI